MASREVLTRAFLWLAVLVGGPLVGAKLFDLVVLAGAWSADPPASLAMMPYGAAWPVDTGVFFIPFSVLLLIAGFGALAAGWKTPWQYRWLLCLPSLGILSLLVLTVLAFWPMNAALYYHGVHSPHDTITDAQAITMTRQWIVLDWFRLAGGAIAFVGSLRALTLPFPIEVTARDKPVVRAILALAMASVVGFAAWFISNI